MLNTISNYTEHIFSAFYKKKCAATSSAARRSTSSAATGVLDFEVEI